MKRPSLSVLTDPVPYGIYFLVEFAKHIARRCKNIIKPAPHFLRSKYRGHFAVTRSLVKGLKKIGVHANYNPRSLSELGEVVVVLSGVAALRQAIRLKRSGRVQRIFAGPNIIVFPSEIRDLICAPEVDWCVVPADWVLDMYVNDCPELRDRCLVWPAGVDTVYWCPSYKIEKRTKILVYEKQVKGPVGPIADYIQILKQHGYQVTHIEYGKYFPDQYLLLLQESCLMVGFVTDESQGLAWAEAWSADVPTLLWYQDHDTFQGRTFSSSTAPYLSRETGLFFSGLAEFKAALSQWEANRESFQPRQWVLENMSDEVCASKLCKMAGVSSRKL